MLGNVRGSFKKVETKEKSGFTYEPQVVESVRERLLGNQTLLDPQGGCVPYMANTSPGESGDWSLAYRATDSLFDSDTESELSDIEMEVVGVAGDSLVLPDLEFLQIDTPSCGDPEEIEKEVEKERHQSQKSQKSIILSKGGMYCVDMSEGDYALVSTVDATPPLTPPPSPDRPRPLVVDNIHEFGSYSLPKCETCAGWDASIWLMKEREKEESGYSSDEPKLSLEIGEAESHKIEVFASPLSTRKCRQRSMETYGRKVATPPVELSWIDDEETESDDCETDDDVSLPPFPDTTQLAVPSSSPPRKPLSRSSSSVWTRQTPIMRLATPAAAAGTPRKKVFPPNYDLAKTLKTPKMKGIKNLDTQLRLQNKTVVEVAPLPRWKKMPVFATTTSGHRAWYQRAMDRIEAARQEAANVGKPKSAKETEKDLDILVSNSFVNCLD
eukprot:sb/3464765/